MIKKFLILLVIISISIPLADAVQLSDKTGLKSTFPIKTDGHSFFIEVTGNLDVTNLDFDKEKKSITLFVLSSIENNSLEINIPQDLIGGNYTFFIDNEEFFPTLKKGNNMAFAIMDFPGVGKHKIEIFGTTYLDIFEIRDVIDFNVSDGYVDEIETNVPSNSLIFTLYDPGDDGKLSITLSDDVITPFDDGSFIVLIDSVESDYSIDNETLNIPFNSGHTKIEIIGTYVVPEFYEIAPLVLATSLISLVVLRKYKKLFA